VLEIRSNPISPSIEPLEDCMPFLLEVERMVDRAMQFNESESNGDAGSKKDCLASDIGTANAAEHRVHGFVDESRFERFLPERRKGSCQ
jgi:hypothetical protein